MMHEAARQVESQPAAGCTLLVLRCNEGSQAIDNLGRYRRQSRFLRTNKIFQRRWFADPKIMGPRSTRFPTSSIRKLSMRCWIGKRRFRRARSSQLRACPGAVEWLHCGNQRRRPCTSFRACTRHFRDPAATRRASAPATGIKRLDFTTRGHKGRHVALI